MDAAELMRLYNLDLQTVTVDINAIVEAERHKVGGVFEVMSASTDIPQSSAFDDEE